MAHDCRQTEIGHPFEGGKPTVTLLTFANRDSRTSSSVTIGRTAAGRAAALRQVVRFSGPFVCYAGDRWAVRPDCLPPHLCEPGCFRMPSETRRESFPPPLSQLVRSPRLPQDRRASRCPPRRLAATFPARAGLHAAGDDTLRVGLVGCGGRGSGAAQQALTADKYTRLVAMGDMFQSQIDSSIAALKGNMDIADRVTVADDMKFVGLDAYKKVIDERRRRAAGVAAGIPAGAPACGRRSGQAHLHREADGDRRPRRPSASMETVAMAKEKNLAIGRRLLLAVSTRERASCSSGSTTAQIGDMLADLRHVPDRTGQADAAGRHAAGGNQRISSGWSATGTTSPGCRATAWSSRRCTPSTGWPGRCRTSPPKAARPSAAGRFPPNGGNIYDHIEVNYLWPNGDARRSSPSGRSPAATTRTALYVIGDQGDRPRSSRAAGVVDQGRERLEVRGPDQQHVPDRARRVLPVDPRRQADQRRRPDVEEHADGHHGPHGRLHRPAGDLGAGAQLDADTRAGRHQGLGFRAAAAGDGAAGRSRRWCEKRREKQEATERTEETGGHLTSRANSYAGDMKSVGTNPSILGTRRSFFVSFVTFCKDFLRSVLDGRKVYRRSQSKSTTHRDQPTRSHCSFSVFSVTSCFSDFLFQPGACAISHIRLLIRNFEELHMRTVCFAALRCVLVVCGLIAAFAQNSVRADDWATVTEDDRCIKIETDLLEAVIPKNNPEAVDDGDREALVRR